MVEGNTLLKACAKKMNQGVFLDGQQKVDMGLERKRKLTLELEVQTKKRKEVLEKKD